MNRCKEGACSTSYPSGNQVDGLPLVAILEEQYQNNRKKKEQAAPHADALDHDEHFFECDCFDKCACESQICYVSHIKDSDRGIQNSICSSNLRVL